MKRALLLAMPVAAIAASAWYLTIRPALAPAPTPGRLSGPPDAPTIEITARHELSRVLHKDASGLSPLEIVSTPQGPITIQRTFKPDGSLFKEEAFLDGKRVPIPQPQPTGVTHYLPQ